MARQVHARWAWVLAGLFVFLSVGRALVKLKDLVRGWNDFAFIYAAGHSWLDLVSPYNVKLWRGQWATIYPSFVGATAAQVSPPNFPYMYPPHWAILAAPLALLPWPVACRIWDFVNVAAYAGIIGLLLTFLPGRVRDVAKNPWIWLVVGLATLNSAVPYALWDGGLCIVPTLGVVGAFWALKQKRTVAMAIFVYLAALKPQIGFLPLVFLLLNGGWRGVLLGAIAMGVVSLAATVPIGISALPSQWRESYHLHLAMEFNALDNFHSVSTFLAFVGLGRASLLSPLLGVVAIVMLTWLRARVAHGEEHGTTADPLSQLCIVIALGVAFVPLHSYDLVILTPLFFWAYTLRRRWIALPIAGLALIASRSLFWGHRLGFPPLGACFSLALAAFCIAAWYIHARGIIDGPAQAPPNEGLPSIS